LRQNNLASIFATVTNSVFLDPETKMMIASGSPKQLLNASLDTKVIRFLTRGKTENRKKIRP
jgi:phospholipid/cholesterol/gamma-HCH transport system ATP-binding protein